MDEIIVTEETATGIAVVKALGKEERVTFDFDSDELSGMALTFHPVYGEPVSVPLQDFLSIEEDGVHLHLDAGTTHITLANTEETATEPPEIDRDATTPPVPEIDDFTNETRMKNYNQLSNTHSVQWHVRQIVHSAGSLSRRELFSELRDRGYDPENSGTVMGALTVLERTTREIRREGRGIDQQIKWTGST